MKGNTYVISATKLAVRIVLTMSNHPVCSLNLYSMQARIVITIKTSSLPTEVVMRIKLMHAGTNIPATATYIDVVDMYKESKESGLLSLPVDYSRFRFPIEPPSVLSVSENKLQQLSEQKLLKDIDPFIHDNNITSLDKTKLVTIMASFANLLPLSSKEKKIGDYWKSLIPKSVLRIANNSQLHKEEQLCKRGINHAMGKASPAILQLTIYTVFVQ